MGVGGVLKSKIIADCELRIERRNNNNDPPAAEAAGEDRAAPRVVTPSERSEHVP